MIPADKKRERSPKSLEVMRAKNQKIGKILFKIKRNALFLRNEDKQSQGKLRLQLNIHDVVDAAADNDHTDDDYQIGGRSWLLHGRAKHRFSGNIIILFHTLTRSASDTVF